MPFDLDWILQSTTLPEPTAPAFVQPSAKPGVAVGDLSLGCGIIAPFQRDGKGDFHNGCAEDLIRASVDRILGITAMSDTTHGELEWMPEFGSLIQRARHANAGDALADLGRYYVIDALRIWEPRINVLDGLVTFEEQTPQVGPPGLAMVIDVLYHIVGKRGGILVPNVNQQVVLNGA